MKAYIRLHDLDVHFLHVNLLIELRRKLCGPDYLFVDGSGHDGNIGRFGPRMGANWAKGTKLEAVDGVRTFRVAALVLRQYHREVNRQDFVQTSEDAPRQTQKVSSTNTPLQSITIVQST